MKITLTLIIALFVMPVSAKTYKCKVNGRATYQQASCVSGGKEIKAAKLPIIIV